MRHRDRRNARLTGLALLALAVLAVTCEPAGARQRRRSKDQPPPPERNAQVYFEEGLLYYNEGQLNRAQERFQQAVQLEPKYPEALYMLGVTYFNLSALDKAEQALRQALDVNPFFTDAHNMLGTVYDQMGRTDKAIAEWNIVLSDQNFPQPWVPAFNIGRAMATGGSWDEAVVWFKRATDLNSSWFRAWFHMGLAQEELGNLQEAKEAHEKALENVPADSPFRYMIQFRLGLTCYKLGYNLCAREHFQEVYDGRPDTAEGKKAREFLDMLRNKKGAADGRDLPASIYR